MKLIKRFAKKILVKNRIAGVGVLATSALFLVACGGQVGGGLPSGVAQATRLTPEQFAYQCQSTGGTLLNRAGTPVCRTIWSPQVFSAFIPMVMLAPSNPGAGQVLGGIIPVRKNDKVTVRSQGSYGPGCWLGGCPGATYSVNNGQNEQTGQVEYWQAVPAGVMMSDGIRTYTATNSAVNDIQNDGVLRFGINFAQGTWMSTSADRTPMLIGITIERCQDAQNVTHPCP